MNTRKKSAASAKQLLQDGLDAHRRGDFVAAENLYRRLLTLQSTDGNAHNLLGILFHQTGRPAEAEPYLRRAVELLPGFADAASNLGLVLLAQQKVDDALQVIGRALTTHPQHWSLLGLRAEAMQRRGQWASALADLQVALQINPQWAEGWRRLAQAAEVRREFPLACAAWSEVVARAPADTRASVSLGQSLFACWRFLDARRVLEDVLSGESLPDIRELALGNLAAVLGKLGLVDEAIRTFEQALAINPEADILWDGLLASLSYSDQVSDEDLYERHRAWGRRHLAERPASISGRAEPRAPRRVGIVSGDLADHAVARFLLSWLGKTDSERYSIQVFSYTPQEDGISSRLQQMVDTWSTVSGLSDAELRERIRSARLDILIELSGHTQPNRLAALNERLATVQATWLGYPATTGLLSIDYRITDETCDPPAADRYATESLARLPGGFLCYCPLDEEKGARIEVAGGDQFVFGCFNNLSKITPRAIRTFSAILDGAKGSSLLLKHFAYNDPSVRDWLVARFVAEGVAAERIRIMSPRVSSREHLESYNEIDLSLDTFPYNGTTTSFESLWMGVPVLSLVGSRHAGRVGASILGSLYGDQAHRWLADSVENYVARAIDIARTGRRNAAERSALRARMEKSPGMDGEGFARKMQAEFDRWLARPAAVHSR